MSFGLGGLGSGNHLRFSRNGLGEAEDYGVARGKVGRQSDPDVSSVLRPDQGFRLTDEINF